MFLLTGNMESKKKNITNSEVKTPATEYTNICLLLFLYVLQGVPLGISTSIPMILQNKNISYKDQVSDESDMCKYQVQLE